jgi:hypothetical protein
MRWAGSEGLSDGADEKRREEKRRGKGRLIVMNLSRQDQQKRPKEQARELAFVELHKI